MKKALKFRVDIEVWQRQNCIKLKVSGQLGVHLKEIKSYRTKLNFVQITKIRPKQRRFEDKIKEQTKQLLFINLFFLPKKVVGITTFQGDLMLRLFIQFNKTYTTMMP
jgi:hypothetical protein